MAEEPRKIKVAQKGFNGKNLMTISCYIEEQILFDRSPKDSVFSDIIFMEFTPDYVAKEKEVMLVNSIDLRSMAYAVKETLKLGSSPYKKYSDPKKAGASGSRKDITFAKKEGGDAPLYYINLTTGAKKIAFSFDTYAFASFSDMLVLLAEETEKALYSLQRKAFSSSV